MPLHFPKFPAGTDRAATKKPQQASSQMSYSGAPGANLAARYRHTLRVHRGLHQRFMSGPLSACRYRLASGNVADQWKLRCRLHSGLLLASNNASSMLPLPFLRITPIPQIGLFHLVSGNFSYTAVVLARYR